jgi:hypothetical protein
VGGNASRSGHRDRRLEHSSQLRVLDAVSLGLRGFKLTLVLFDHAVDRGQVGLLCWTVKPRVNLHPLEEKGFQDGIAFLLMSLRERSTLLFHSYPPKEAASEEVHWPFDSPLRKSVNWTSPTQHCGRGKHEGYRPSLGRTRVAAEPGSWLI